MQDHQAESLTQDNREEEEEDTSNNGYDSGNGGSATKTQDASSIARKNANKATDTGNNSDDSFEFDAHFHTSSKAVTLMRARKQSASSTGKNTYTYQEDVGLLDNQLIFESVIHNGRDMYELVTGVTGKPTSID